jgi:hypothetical protein
MMAVMEAALGWSISIGSVKGTAVRLHFTFLLFLAWVGHAMQTVMPSVSAWDHRQSALRAKPSLRTALRWK